MDAVKYCLSAIISDFHHKNNLIKTRFTVLFNRESLEMQEKKELSAFLVLEACRLVL